MKNFSIILAVDNENGLGNNNDLAWDIPEDRKYFRKITTKTKDSKKQNAVIMGRKTWESIPKKYRPFPKRYNCILSKSCKDGSTNKDGAIKFNSLDTCLEHLEKNKDIESIFVVGGAQIYNQVVSDNRLQKAYVTRIYNKYHCDSFFDGLPLGFDLQSRSEMKEYKGIEFEFSVYIRKVSLISKIKKIFKK